MQVSITDGIRGAEHITPERKPDPSLDCFTPHLLAVRYTEDRKIHYRSLGEPVSMTLRERRTRPPLGNAKADPFLFSFGFLLCFLYFLLPFFLLLRDGFCVSVSQKGACSAFPQGHAKAFLEGLPMDLPSYFFTASVTRRPTTACFCGQNREKGSALLRGEKYWRWKAKGRRSQRAEANTGVDTGANMNLQQASGSGCRS